VHGCSLLPSLAGGDEPGSHSRKHPEWIDALAVYRRSFDASSAAALTEGAEAFAEVSPDDQALHQGASRRALSRGSGPGLRSLRALSARRLRRRSLRVACGDHLAFRQMQALGDVFAVLRRIEARLARLDDGVGGATKNLRVMRKALVTLARGQEALLGALAEGGSLEAAVNGDDDDHDEEDDDDPSDDDPSDDDDSDGDENAEKVEEEDHGHGDGPEVVVSDEIIPAPPRAAPEAT
jgi:hypothetical protein